MSMNAFHARVAEQRLIEVGHVKVVPGGTPNMASTQLAVASTQAAPLAEAASASLTALYFSDNRPWVVAFSGGKDSTVVLQLVFDILLRLGEKAKKPVFVLSSDTQVEAPNVAAYVSCSHWSIFVTG